MIHDPNRTKPVQYVAGSGALSAAGAAAMALGALTLVSAVQIYAVRRASNEDVSLWRAILFGIATWGVWAVAVPIVVALGRKFDFRAGRRTASAVVHVAALCAVHVPATMLVFVAGLQLFGGGFPQWTDVLRQAFVGTRLQLTVILYAALLGLVRASELRRHLREEQARAARADVLATHARLAALAARLQPHFLFNALHAAGALIAEDPTRARAMLAQLGDLLRDALADGASGDVTLAEEFRLLERYLAIETVRFSDRLRVELTCEDTVRDVPVPRFLLQPLVENALQHGIARSALGGRVSVVARATAGHVDIRVFNDGLAPPSRLNERGGLGMTRDRLQTRYGSDARLDLIAPAGGGAEAVVAIPLRLANIS